MRVMRSALPHRKSLVLVILLIVVTVCLDLLKPWPMKLIVDNVIADKPLPNAVAWMSVLPGGLESIGLLAWLVAGTVLVFLAHGATTICQRYVKAGVGVRMVYTLGGQLFDHIQRLSLRFHGKHSTGDLVQRVTSDCGCVRDLVLGVGIPLLTSLVTLVLMFIVMWQLDHWLALLALLVAIPMGVLIKILAGPMTERKYEESALKGEMMAAAEQTLTALPIVQAFNRQCVEDERFHALSQRTIRANLGALISELRFKIGVGTFTAFGTAGIMIIGGYHVLDGSLTIGELLVILAYLASLYGPLESLAYLSLGYTTAAAGARRVLEVLDTDELVREAPDAVSLPPRDSGAGRHVRFEDVTFGYEAGRPVLKGITLEAESGETIALVGATGAGKSTLVSMIPRFFDPWEGRITIDGTDLREVRLAELRAQVGLVLQEPFLLPLTVAENIAYGRPTASHAEIVAAATVANADEFIVQLPDGYDSVVGERGATLSGGQQQRLSIARALLKDAPVLILDEPTSALDAATEASLMEALRVLMRGRTTFIIAHRLSTIRNADRIVVIDNGAVVETGTHDTLIAKAGRYRSFHDLQFSAVAESNDAAADPRQGLIGAD
jgi:ATP-binding cassette subfamily B protein/subfamily B ATP-binding cassette protein MsbA